MKYHYQYVSKTSVRIELIAEDQKERALLAALTPASAQASEQLETYFLQGLSAYKKGARLKKTSFMQYPNVALCSFETVTQPASKP